MYFVNIINPDDIVTNQHNWKVVYNKKLYNPSMKVIIDSLH